MQYWCRACGFGTDCLELFGIGRLGLRAMDSAPRQLPPLGSLLSPPPKTRRLHNTEKQEASDMWGILRAMITLCLHEPEGEVCLILHSS